MQEIYGLKGGSSTVILAETFSISQLEPNKFLRFNLIFPYYV